MTRSVYDVRPPDVPAQWWYRATWLARREAVRAANQRAIEATQRERREEAERDAEILAAIEAADLARRAEGAVNRPRVHVTERLAQVEELLDKGRTFDEIILLLGVSAGSLDMAMRRAGRPDLGREFGHRRTHEGRKSCPECGGRMARGSVRCMSCKVRRQRGSAA